MDVSVRLQIHLLFRLFLVSWFQKDMRDCREEKVHIDSYQFGKIIIDGMAYESDCLIFGDSIDANWWRKQGHVLDPEDLQLVIEAKPAILIVGSGSPGLMKISEDTRQVLQHEGIELIALDTHTAVVKFNELAKKGENVAAALHLSC